MMKTLVLAGVLGTAATTAAQPASPAPQPPAQSIRISLSIKAGNDVRTHELVISDRGCGLVKEKTSQYEDDVRVCSVPTANGVAIDLEGMIRVGSAEYRQRAEAIIARKGASFEVGRANGMRFAVKTL